MTEADESAPTAAEAASEALGPEVRLLAGLDSAAFTGALGEVGAAIAQRPAAVAEATWRYAYTLAEIQFATAGRWLGCHDASPRA